MNTSENCALPGSYAASSGNSLLTFRGKPIGPENSVRNYHYSLRNNPEARSSHLFSGGILKSRRRINFVTSYANYLNVIVFI